MITGLTMTGLYPQDCSHGVEMFYCADANVSGTVPPAWLEHSARFYTIFPTDIIQQNFNKCKPFYASNFFIFIWLNLLLQVRNILIFLSFQHDWGSLRL